MDKSKDAIEASRLEDLGVTAEARSFIRRDVPAHEESLKRFFNAKGILLSGQSNALAAEEIVLLGTTQSSYAQMNVVCLPDLKNWFGRIAKQIDEHRKTFVLMRQGFLRIADNVRQMFSYHVIRAAAVVPMK